MKGKIDALSVAAANLLKRKDSNHSNRLLSHRNVLTVSPLAASVALS